MLACLMYRTDPQKGGARFYRVEIAHSLFGDFSVVREWGLEGRHGRSITRLYGNLRDASVAADKWREGALKRGYERRDVLHDMAAMAF